MAKAKVYAVKNGYKTGIFDTWDECSEAVKGYSGAQYKSFTNRADAENYLSGEDACAPQSTATKTPYEGAVAYVDGSFSESLGRYGFGVHITKEDGSVHEACGHGTEENLLAHRNVSGEMCAAQYAVEYALKHRQTSVTVIYDYAGIEQWAVGNWKTNTPATANYKKCMQDLMSQIPVKFIKVKGHTGVEGNEKADRLAWTGIQSDETFLELNIKAGTTSESLTNRLKKK